MPTVIETEKVKKSIKDAQNAVEAMEFAGLDWNVEQAPLMTQSGLDVPSHKALYRSDNNGILAVVGHGYRVFQNHEIFAIADTLKERFDAEYESAVCMGGGSKLMLQMKINGGFDIRGRHGVDHIDNYINIVDFRGGGSAQLFCGSLRAFCMNQLNALLRNASERVVVQHSASLHDRIQKAMEAWSMSQKWFEIFQEKASYLAQKAVDKKMVESFLDQVIGLPVTEEWDEEQGRNVTVEHPRINAQRERVVDLFENGQGNHGENAWELLNGVTELVDHYKNVDNADKRLTSALLGHGADVKQKAFEVALAL